MTRIPYVRREELGPEGQQLWDGIVNSVGELVVTADGGLAGPFNAFVTAPGAGRRLSSLGAKLRFGTSIERRLSEIAIITTGARWQAEFEWWAHAPMAREHGVAGAVVDAIGRGEDPPIGNGRAIAVLAAREGEPTCRMSCSLLNISADRVTRPDVQAALTVVGRRDAKRDYSLLKDLKLVYSGVVVRRGNVLAAG